MKECTTEYMLQAYFDGELSAIEMRGVATHLAVCAKCSALAQEINSEIEALTFALAPELELPVPTESLRARLDIALAEIAGPQPVLSRLSWFSRLGEWFQAFNLTPQFAFGGVAFALLLAGIVFLATYTKPENGLGAGNLARRNWPVLEIKPKPAASPVPDKSPGKKPEPQVISVKYSKPLVSSNKKYTAIVEGPRQLELKLLPGEENYLKTIASLERAVAAQQAEFEVQPKLRTVYERNVAVLDQAILATQRAARRNPKDTDAVEFLYSTYQTKVELMNTYATSVRPMIAER